MDVEVTDAVSRYSCGGAMLAEDRYRRVRAMLLMFVAVTAGPKLLRRPARAMAGDRDNCEVDPC